MARVGFISLGCAKNQIDCENMMYNVQQAGHTLTTSVHGADVVIINTCGFIDSAKAEAIRNILAMGQEKEKGNIGKILVTGCLAQRYKDEIMKEMPEVDGVLGTGSYGDVLEAIDQLMEGKTVSRYGSINQPIDNYGRVLTTPRHYAYLKIAEGCDHRCAYCVIPSLRGKYRSRPMDEVLAEAKFLAKRGVKELLVVAQDTSRYGVDFPDHKRHLSDLVRELVKIDGIHWIRLHYLYPDAIDEELIDLIANEPKIVKYLDIPIQHINNHILKTMCRIGDGKFVEDLLTELRRRIPGLVLRTSLITGLPGEGEAEFEELCEFLKRAKLERVGAFAFSPEEGTPAAEMEYPDSEIAAQRAEIVEEIQSRIIDDYHASLLGKTLEVLVDEYDPQNDRYFGRTYADSPEIDGGVWFTSDREIPVGSFCPVEVQEALEGELFGQEVAYDNCK